MKEDQSFRVRKLLDNRIITKEMENKHLYVDDQFIEGGTRLRVEYGEMYGEDESVIFVLVETDHGKELQELICDVKTTTLQELKEVFCSNYKYDPNVYGVYLANDLDMEVKHLKKEGQTLRKLGVEDTDKVIIKNIASIVCKDIEIKLYLHEDEAFSFDPVPETACISTIILPKTAKLSELREKVKETLGKEIDSKQIRLRNISKKGEIDRIFRKDNFTLNRLNLDSPAKVHVEILDSPENLPEKSMQLYLLTRDSEKREFTSKESVLFTYSKAPMAEDLFKFIRERTGLSNIGVAKYDKTRWDWEIIAEGKGSLKKNYNMKDGDWIGVRNNEVKGALSDSFKSKEDVEKIKLNVKESQPVSRRRVVEKPFRIKRKEDK